MKGENKIANFKELMGVLAKRKPIVRLLKESKKCSYQEVAILNQRNVVSRR
jgi:hypothetical protein